MVKRTTIGEAFQVNPKVTIKKGQVIPFVSMDQLMPGQGRVSASEIRTFKGGSKFQHGDTLMARITPCLENGKISRYLSVDVDQPAAGSTEFIVIRGKDGCSTTPFAYYFAISPDIRELSISLMTGTSGRQRVDVDAFKDSEVMLPPLAVQRDIASVLGALDDKIAANLRVIDRADVLRGVIWEKLLEKGTEQVPLSSLATFVNGRAFTKNATGTGKVVIRIAELNSGIGANTVFNDISVDLKYIAFPGDLLFAWSGTLMVKRWPYEEAIVNQHIFKVIPGNIFDRWSLECVINSRLEHYRTIAAGKATTMGHIKRSDLDDIVTIPTAIPENINSTGNNLWELATKFELENQALAKTRDELLPLLMSGKITVREAEEAAAEVGVKTREEEGNV